MSTATYNRPLHAVPPPPDTKARFAFILAVRRRAQQALDAVLALPRGAAGWAVRHLRSLLGGTQHRLAGWASSGVRGAVTLVRRVGVVPLAAALLSTPAVWSRTTKVARTAGSAIACVARGLWRRAKGLLTRGGATGDRIAQALSGAGNGLAAAVRTTRRHPASRWATRAVRDAAALVRPLSHSLVVHRVVGLLIPVAWLRVALQMIAIPLVMAAGLPVARGSGLFAGPAVGPQTASHVACVDVKPAPDGEAMAAAEPASDVGGDADWTPELKPRNRAERRAQQQEQARARKAPSKRPTP